MDTGKMSDRYVIRLCISSTTVSEVYLAQDSELGYFRVIKKIRKATDPGCIMQKGYEILIRLRHDSISRIFGIEEDETSVYIDEEYIDGEDIGTIIKREGRMNPSSAVNIAIQLCDALTYIHTLKPNPIIHKNVKPTNIIISKNGELKLTDFGIIRECSLKGNDDPILPGTKGYTAPEQFAQSRTDARTDIYSTGLLLYHMLTGQDPNDMDFSLRSFEDLGLNLPEELFEIIAKATSIEPQYRHKTASMLKAELEAILPRVAVEEKSLVPVWYQANIPFSNIPMAQVIHAKRKRSKEIMLAAVVSGAAVIITFVLFASGFFKTNSITASTVSMGESAVSSDSEKSNGAMAITQNSQQATGNTDPGSAAGTDDANSREPVTSVAPQTPDKSTPIPEPADSPVATATNAPEPDPTPTATPQPEARYLNSVKCEYIKTGFDKYLYVKLNPGSDNDINNKSYKSGFKIGFAYNSDIPYEKQYVRAQYDLNQAFGKLTLIFSACWESRDMPADQTAWINIIGDGELLASSNLVGPGTQPQKLVVNNLKKVKKLAIEVIAGSELVSDASFIIGDPILTK